MKHALLRLGPNTTLLSLYFPSLRFSPPSISLSVAPSCSVCLQAGCSNHSSYWRLLASPIIDALSLPLTQEGVRSLPPLLPFFFVYPQFLLNCSLQLYSASAQAPCLDNTCWFVRNKCSQQLIAWSFQSLIAMMLHMRVEF